MMEDVVTPPKRASHPLPPSHLVFITSEEYTQQGQHLRNLYGPPEDMDSASFRTQVTRQATTKSDLCATWPMNSCHQGSKITEHFDGNEDAYIRKLSKFSLVSTGASLTASTSADPLSALSTATCEIPAARPLVTLPIFMEVSTRRPMALNLLLPDTNEYLTEMGRFSELPSLSILAADKTDAPSFRSALSFCPEQQQAQATSVPPYALGSSSWADAVASSQEYDPLYFWTGSAAVRHSATSNVRDYEMASSDDYDETAALPSNTTSLPVTTRLGKRSATKLLTKAVLTGRQIESGKTSHSFHAEFKRQPLQDDVIVLTLEEASFVLDFVRKFGSHEKTNGAENEQRESTDTNQAEKESAMCSMCGSSKQKQLERVEPAELSLEEVSKAADSSEREAVSITSRIPSKVSAYIRAEEGWGRKRREEGFRNVCGAERKPDLEGWGENANRDGKQTLFETSRSWLENENLTSAEGGTSVHSTSVCPRIIDWGSMEAGEFLFTTPFRKSPQPHHPNIACENIQFLSSVNTEEEKAENFKMMEPLALNSPHFATTNSVNSNGPGARFRFAVQAPQCTSLCHYTDHVHVQENSALPPSSYSDAPSVAPRMFAASGSLVPIHGLLPEMQSTQRTRIIPCSTERGPARPPFTHKEMPRPIKRQEQRSLSTEKIVRTPNRLLWQQQCYSTGQSSAQEQADHRRRRHEEELRMLYAELEGGEEVLHVIRENKALRREIRKLKNEVAMTTATMRGPADLSLRDAACLDQRALAVQGHDCMKTASRDPRCMGVCLATSRREDWMDKAVS
ncbi:hypothetical protein V5799_009231 [Amblyomma americanum]|uniref:Uncharacterized protein n=1 Tax=Amblyomma americanum TaxID=6943 RepID=A0AAQ4FAX0_AMBAM